MEERQLGKEGTVQGTRQALWDMQLPKAQRHQQSSLTKFSRWEVGAEESVHVMGR